MINLEDGYMNYLKYDKKLSNNTLNSYKRDIEQYLMYLEELKCDILKSSSPNVIVTYLLYLKNKDRKASTISRKLVAIRSFYRYLIKKGLMKDNPTACFKLPKIEKKQPEILTPKEIENLLKQPECVTKKGIRDKAMLELMCATGTRVSELMALNLKDINWANKTITFNKKRSLHVNSDILQYMWNYIKISRTDDKEEAVFLNIYGKRMTRQGFWKIIKFYKNKANLNKNITPQTLRHSLAVNLLKEGTNITKIKNMLGHKDIATTIMYNKLLKIN